MAEADKPMAALKPPEMAAVMVEEPLLPWTTVTDAGEAERLKLGPEGVPASALIRPTHSGLPQPVARS